MLLSQQSRTGEDDVNEPCAGASSPARAAREAKASCDRSAWLQREVIPHEPLLRQWLLPKLRCQVALDDVMQDVFLRLSQTASVEHILNAKNYLWTTAVSVLRDHARRSRATPVAPCEPTELDEVTCTSPSPLQQLCAREDLKLLLDAMEQLPARTRQVLVLRRLEELSLQETASAIGISVSAVEKHQRRGHAFLKDQMASP